MKDKIKVFLQYPWKFPDSPYYKYLIQDIDNGIEYYNVEKQNGTITNPNLFWVSNFLKRVIRGLTRNIAPYLLNAHLSDSKGCDLIHCAHCLSKNKNKPWVADFEAFWQLWISTKKTKLGLRKVEKILNNKNCKKILPWTKKVYDEFLYHFPKHKDKFEILFPAVPLKVDKKISSSKNIKLIFVGRYFFQKGGFHALEAMDRLTKKYKNVEAMIVSVVPEEFKEKYSKNKKIQFFPLMPQEKVFDLYKCADISIYPGYSDSLGYAFLEAMSFGIPTITVDGDSRKELIDQGKNGILIDRPKKFNWNKIGNVENLLINNIVEEASKLIEDKILRMSMSNNCIDIIKRGKFSINNRNKKLKNIYKEALK